MKTQLQMSPEQIQRLRESCMTEVMTAGPEVARIEQVTRKELVYIKGESEFEVYK